MGSKKGNTGSAATATTLALFLVALTVFTVYIFVAKPIWSWFPPAINEIGHEIDRQFMRTLVITGVVFVLAQFGLAWVVFRYRTRGQRATYSHGNNVMEVIWTLATAILFIGLGIYAQRAWAEVRLKPAPPDAMRIEVIGQQFKWSFRLPGPDGKFGKYKFEAHPEQEFTRDPWVVDADDPDGKDDVILGPGSVFAVVVDQPVELLIRSKDVTHSFFVRELRLKQDAVPGMTVPLQFTATVPGEYQVVCAELCGQGHHLMGTFMKVLSREDYAAWLKDMTAE
ncbi:MAG: cytochrome c oxidase subunit II [Acidobacteria bacterium]|nr:cytochrome c oxidase subunit II [Acidobacteriota bacterium]MCL5289221.1 cytochrome c oxidase subunit II [Acidobacteriota bacterium]